MKVLLRWLIRFYQVVISPAIGPRCRYYPTCSQYALEAIAIHGAWQGTWLTTKRLCRCHPWGGFGYDPVPHRPRHTHYYVLLSTPRRPRIPFLS